MNALICSLKLSHEPSYWIIQAVALGITAFVLPGLRVTGLLGPILLVAALAVVNVFLWDAALFFHIPRDLSTHALLIVAWNAAIFWFLVKIIPGVEIQGIVAPILAPLIITVTTLFAGQYASKIDWEKLASGVVNGVQEQRDLLRKAEERRARGEDTRGGAETGTRSPGPLNLGAQPAAQKKSHAYDKF